MKKVAVVLPPRVKALATKLIDRRSQMRRAQIRYAEAEHDAVKAIRQSGVSLRAAGVMLGLSRERIRQIEKRS